jgi:hypothetical protein
VHWYQGDLDGAQAASTRRTRCCCGAGAAPRNTELLFQLSTIDNNAGHVLEGRGRIERSDGALPAHAAMAPKLAALRPANVEWQNQLGLAHNNLAKMALLQGRPGRADRRLRARRDDRGGAGRARSAQQLAGRAPADRARPRWAGRWRWPAARGRRRGPAGRAGFGGAR